jgi:hypothetical protein
MRLARAIVAMFLLIAPYARAESRMRLPLDGYYHPGRGLPVIVESSDSAFTISADRAIPSQIAAGRIGIAAVLLLDATQTLHAADRDLSLHPLSSNERLIGILSDDDEIPEIFPNHSIIKIHLNPADLQNNSLAWQSLDAIVFNHSIESSLMKNLLGSGITIAVKSSDVSDRSWPWKKSSAFWILQPGPAGPGDAIAGNAAYLPTQSWQPGQPAILRRKILLTAVLVTLLVMSSLLIRSRWSIVLMAAIALICGGAIESWRRNQPAIRGATGQIIVNSNGFQEIDTWRYFTSAHGAQMTVANGTPILLDIEHAIQIDLKLQANADGSDAWQFTLPVNSRITFLSREFSPKSALNQIEATSRSPMYELAREMYLGSDRKILGEIAPTQSSDDSWRTVVVGRE